MSVIFMFTLIGFFQVRIFSSSMASRRSGQENSAPLTADLTIRLPPVQHNGNIVDKLSSHSSWID